MSASIAVAGTGYVGLTTGACLSHLGHDVVCHDVDSAKVAALRDGRIPIRESGLDRLVEEGLHLGQLDFTTDVEKAVRERDVVFLCLPTPQRADGSADLSVLHAACRDMGPHLEPGAIVVNKSTTPVGTTRELLGVLGRTDVHVVSNPEFLSQGTAVENFLHPDRIVIGADDKEVALKVASLYLGLSAPWVVTDPSSAELVKYVANSFLATKVSFVNSVAAVAERVGADVDDVIAGVGFDRRIGHDFLRPGPGWGGSCLPKDTAALAALSRAAGFEFELLDAAISVNQQQPERIVDKVTDLLGGPLDGRSIAVWGLTFKANTDDLRDSPALEVVRRLVERGADVAAYDPGIRSDRHAIEGVRLVDDPLQATHDRDVLVVLTEWPEFRRADLEQLRDSLRRPNVVDARNVMDRAALTRRGFAVRSIGRG